MDNTILQFIYFSPIILNFKFKKNEFKHKIPYYRKLYEISIILIIFRKKNANTECLRADSKIMM